MVSKKIVGLLILGVIGIGIVSLGIGVTAVSALSSREKAEKLAELTDKPVEEIIEERYSKNKTYGEIAEENGVLDQFQTQNINCDGTGNSTHDGRHSAPASNRHHNDVYGYGHRGRNRQ